MGFFDKEQQEEQAHLDDWLMSYADMITLMLCFFAIILSVSVPKQQKLEEAQKEMAGVFAREGIAKTMQEGKPVDVQPSEAVAGEGILDGLPSIIDRYREGNINAPEKPYSIQQAGKRISTIEMNSAFFFDTGSATLSDEGKEALGALTPSLQSQLQEGYIITVEGHTDDNPISTAQFPSNWELSAARAAAVVRHFIELGLPASQLRAAGYADTHPKMPNRDIYGHPIPDNQMQNRRVLIKLEKISENGE